MKKKQLPDWLVAMGVFLITAELTAGLWYLALFLFTLPGHGAD